MRVIDLRSSDFPYINMELNMSRNNCFDVARHIAAIAVIFSHHFAFNGLPEPKVLGITKLGTFAVLVFFSISG